MAYMAYRPTGHENFVSRGPGVPQTSPLNIDNIESCHRRNREVATQMLFKKSFPSQKVIRFGKAKMFQGRSCQSRITLKHAVLYDVYSATKIGGDTAEDEPRREF